MIPVWEHDETPSLGLEWLGMSKRTLQWSRLAQLGGCIATGVYVWSVMFQIQLASWNPMAWLSVSARPNLHTHRPRFRVLPGSEWRSYLNAIH